MTHPYLISTVTATLVALAVVATVAGAGAATQTADEPAIRITDTTTAGDNTTADVVLTSAPEGLAGYYLDVVVDAPESARVVDASYPDQFGLTTTPEYADDGSTVTLEAGDLNDAVQPGARNVVLATVEVAGVGAGDLSLSVEPRRFDDDEGSSFQPAQVRSETTPAESNTATESNASTTIAAQAPTDGQGTANASATTTGGNGPLLPALVVRAAALLTAVGLRRHDP